MNKEVSMDEVTTATPPQSPGSNSDGSATYAIEDPPVTSVPSSDAIVDNGNGRVSQSPVYIHAQPVIADDGPVTSPPMEVVVPPVTSPSPSPPSSDSSTSSQSLPAMEAEPVSEGTLEPLPSSRKPTYSTLAPFSLVALSKASRRADDEGIRVIDALKDIVRQAQKQHAQNDRPIPSPITLTLTDTALSKSGIQNLQFGGLPPVAMPFGDDSSPQKIMPGTGLHGDDDDEMEVEVNEGALDPAAATTDAIDDFAKVVVMVPSEEKNDDDEIDTAPSVEVVHSNKIRMYKSDMVDEITASILCQHRGGGGERADLEECGLDMLVLNHKIKQKLMKNLNFSI